MSWKPSLRARKLTASGEMPLGGAAAGVKRSAVMYVAAVITCSSLRSPRMLAIIAETFSPVLICSTARYLSTPQRAMHSKSSSPSNAGKHSRAAESLNRFMFMSGRNKRVSPSSSTYAFMPS